MVKRSVVGICCLAAGLCSMTTANADVVVSNLPATTPGTITRYSNSGVPLATVQGNGEITKEALLAGTSGTYYATGMAASGGVYYQFNTASNSSAPLAAAPAITATGGLATPAIGPNGDLFVPAINRLVAGNPAGIIELNGTTGAYVGMPITYSGTALYAFRDVAISPDNHMYVADAGHIDAYDMTGGSFTHDANFGIALTFGAAHVPSSAGVIRFKGTSSDLYISDQSSIRIYSSTDGALLGTFVAAGTGGLGTISDFTFGDDGYAYVVSTASGSSSVMRFNATTGGYVDTLIAATPTGSFVPQIAYLAAVPEPTSLALFAAGMIGAIVKRRR